MQPTRITVLVEAGGNGDKEEGGRRTLMMLSETQFLRSDMFRWDNVRIVVS